MRACGVLDTRVPHAATPLKLFTVNQVSARRLSCARARGFVRAWNRAADHGKFGHAAAGKIRNGRLVYYKWGPVYRVSGFVCRSMAIQGPGPLQPERVTCGSHAGLVTWRESGRYG